MVGYRVGPIWVGTEERGIVIQSKHQVGHLRYCRRYEQLFLLEVRTGLFRSGSVSEILPKEVENVKCLSAVRVDFA